MPMETITYLNLTGNPGWFHYRVFNATSEYVISLYINQTENVPHTFYIIQDSLFDSWNADKANSRHQYYDTGLGSALSMKYSYTFPSSDTWHIVIQYVNSGVGTNVTVRTIINKI